LSYTHVMHCRGFSGQPKDLYHRRAFQGFRDRV